MSKMRRGEPLVQRDMAALVQRADCHSERLATSIALIQAGAVRLAVHERGFVDRAALGANGTVWPNPCLKPLAGFVGIVKDRV